jgi:hypothetical protein
MDLETFHDLRDASGPFASVTIDVTRKDPSYSEHIEVRWRDSERRLTELGAPAAVVRNMQEPALAPTGHGGDWGRLIVANADGLLQTVDLPGRVTEEAMWGPIPLLLHAIRSLACLVPHVVVRLDRTGADLEVVTGSDAERLSVQGGHDELHHVPTGGMRQRRYQARVEDSWEHNASAVAQELDRVVRQHRPAVVLLMGDEHARGFLEAHASAATRALFVRTHTGGRAEGTSAVAERAAVESALASHRASREAALVARFREEEGRAEGATSGLEPVIDVLQRAQVEQLLLVEGRLRERTLWAGSGRLQLGASRSGAELAGARDPQRVPADSALVWAAVCSRAAVTLLDRGQVNPADGVGAVLRWVDGATPRTRVPSMPGHGGQ